MTAKWRSPGVLALVVLVVGAVAAGFWVMGTPGEARLRRLDSRRMNDLQRAKSAIDAHWRGTGRLPASLAELGDSINVPDIYRDPASREPYEYRVTGDRSYQLCAIFARASEEEEEEAAYPAARGFRTSHRAGRHCFTLRAETT